MLNAHRHLYILISWLLRLPFLIYSEPPLRVTEQSPTAPAQYMGIKHPKTLKSNYQTILLDEQDG
jgi:hypothetical protein